MIELDCLYYFNNFYGYGNWNSDYWFIGIEEGGGRHVEKIYDFRCCNHKSSTLIDNYGFQNKYTPSFFSIEVQKHWKRNIQILLYIRDNKFYTDKLSILNFQKNHWGNTSYSSKDGVLGNAIIELLPLPVVSFNNDIFKHKYYTFFRQFQNVKDFYKKKEYRNYNWHARNGPNRLTFIASKIKLHSPKLVVASVGTYKNEFESIVLNATNSPVNLWQEIVLYKNKSAMLLKTNSTLFVFCHQPNFAWGNEYWLQLAKIIKLLL